MSEATSFVDQFRAAVCQEVSLAQHGLDRYVVHVPFTFDDGDHYVVVAERDGEEWAFTDEGHTLMHLSYTAPQFDKGNRRSIIDRILRLHRVQENQGELRVAFTPERAGDAFFSFVQAITQVMDVSFLSRERVRSTFAEDFQSVLDSAGEGRVVERNYFHPQHDSSQLYPVDARINGVSDSQLLVFAIGNDDQCQRATITLYRWESWGEPFGSIGIFRDQTEINRHVLARFSDVAGRQFSSIETARERFPHAVADFLNGKEARNG